MSLLKSVPFYTIIVLYFGTFGVESNFLNDLLLPQTITTDENSKLNKTITSIEKFDESNEKCHCETQNVIKNNNITLVFNIGGEEMKKIIIKASNASKLSENILAEITTLITTELPELLPSTTTEKPVLCTIPLAREFPQLHCNILSLNFSKPVTTKEELKNALKNPLHHIIKIPVAEGRVDDKGPKQPIVGNNQQISRDLSLDEAFNLTYNYNDNQVTGDKMGIELIFRNTLDYRAALGIVKKWYPKFESLLILNADILKKSNSIAIPIDPEIFLIGGKQFKLATLSVGWAEGEESNYSNEEIDEMLNILETYKVTQPVTFRMNVLAAANNLKGVTRLMESKPTATLSMFSKNAEKVGVNKLDELVKSFGANRIYLSELPNGNKKLMAYLLWLLQ